MAAIVSSFSIIEEQSNEGSQQNLKGKEGKGSLTASVKRKFLLTPLVGFDVTCCVTRASKTDAHHIRSDNL